MQLQTINLKNRDWKSTIPKSIKLSVTKHFFDRILERIVHDKSQTDEELLIKLNSCEFECIMSYCFSDNQYFLYLPHVCASIPIKFDKVLNCWVALTIENDYNRIGKNRGIEVKVNWVIDNRVNEVEVIA